MNIKPEEKAGDSQSGSKIRLCFVHQVVAKLVVDCSHHLRSGDPERHEEPEGSKVEDSDCKITKMEH